MYQLGKSNLYGRYYYDILADETAMGTRGLEIIAVEYEDRQMPSLIKEFRPMVFKDGNSFCVILGPDPQEGVFSCGATPEAALLDWDKHLRERAKDPKAGDELDEYIQDILAKSKWTADHNQ